MTNPTSNFGWQMPTSTDLVTDLPADFEVFGQAVDTALADLRGGTTNQVLAKNSNTDMDFKWVTDATGMTNPMTTTGDTIYSSSGSTPARLGIGSTGQVLTVSGGLPTWAAVSAGVKQVVTANTASATTRTSDGTSNTALTASITPSSTGSKIVVIVVPYQTYITKAAGRSDFPQLNLLIDVNSGTRTSSSYGQIYDSGRNSDTNLALVSSQANILYVDSPNSTSSQTYLLKLNSGSNASADYGEATFQGGQMILMEI